MFRLLAEARQQTARLPGVLTPPCGAARGHRYSVPGTWGGAAVRLGFSVLPNPGQHLETEAERFAVKEMTRLQGHPFPHLPQLKPLGVEGVGVGRRRGECGLG